MSDNEKSMTLHTHWRSSAQKFDYFVLGATGALCAFISQTFTPERIAFSPATVELASLLILIVSGLFGFIRIEAVNAAWVANFHELFLGEESEKMKTAAERGKKEGMYIYLSSSDNGVSPDDLKVIAKQKRDLAAEVSVKGAVFEKDAYTYYKVRNYLLLAGIVTLLIARIWKPYY